MRTKNILGVLALAVMVSACGGTPSQSPTTPSPSSSANYPPASSYPSLDVARDGLWGASVSQISSLPLLRVEDPLSSSSSSSLIPHSQSPTRPAKPEGRSGIPILVYHHLGTYGGKDRASWNAKMYVSPTAFEAQMQWLSDHGYQTIPIGDVVPILRREKTGPAKPFVITFDDGNLTPFSIGFPILQRHGFSAVFSIITSKLENPNTINRDRVAVLLKSGMEIGSHTVSHALLTRLSDNALDRELRESRATLEALTGAPVLSLAYPMVDQNRRVREHAAAAGYTTGTIMDPRPATANDDPLKLPRILMLDETEMGRAMDEK